MPGGGIALFNIVYKDFSLHEVKKEIAEALTAIFKRALKAPITAIIENSGGSPAEILGKLENRGPNELWHGFNAAANEIDNLKEAGIIDPLKVVKTAFLNAVSVASNYLTIGAAIADLPEKKNPANAGPGMDDMM